MPAADGSRLERVRRLFDEVVDLPTGERAAVLAAAAAGEGDRTLAREVDELIQASLRAPGFLERPAAACELEGRMAGPWRIEALLASGGMADVYRAVRDDADLAWRAAVKVLKPGLDGASLSARFRAERRVLAALSHPNIVVLLDAGTIADGRLYLAMELIDGAPIGRYCADGKLDVRGRLELFLQVCAAVQYAHQRLVVHCDLKPSNVLVTRDGVPKLLDFGVSTLLGPVAREGESASPITPAYASPEQIRGEVVTAAADVWSLGVMLYELVSGRRPYDVFGLTPTEVLARQALRPTPISHDDLDAVAMKALEPDPVRRYPSVEAFAADLRRFLAHRPVSARPASSASRIKMFLRRNRWAAAAAGVVVVSLAVGAVGLYRGLLGAREEARLGWRAHRQAVQVSRFLEDMIAELNRPSVQNPEGREALLDRAAARIDVSFAEYPETEGRLRMAIAELYLDMERPAKADPHLRRAVEIVGAHRGFGKTDLARAEELLARANAAAATRRSTAR
jgi:tRNA A-37 threonylcarbamoyl transferase component Bud32